MKTLDDPGGGARLFVALWPTPAVRLRLAAHQALWQWPPGARPAPPGNLHLTLHFIGTVPRARIEALARALHRPLTRCTLTLDAPEVWPNRCAVWCASQVPEALAALHGTLAAELAGQDLPVDTRPFRPHVTLARHAQGARPPADAATLHWPVRGYALLQSAAGRYTPVAHFA